MFLIFSVDQSMVRTRSANPDLLDCDAEVERTFLQHLRHFVQDFVIQSAMGDAGRTLRELTDPDLTQ